VARLDAVRKAPPRTFGTMSFHVPQSFDEDLPASELEAWE
jgi:hypothetical protein